MPNKRNSPCECGSKKKYKHCCEGNDLFKKHKEQAAERENENKILDQYRTGHDVSSEKVQTVYDLLKETHDDCKVIDISNILTEERYRPIQEYNYFKDIIMIAERNVGSESVFAARCPASNDFMVMFQGAYQCFDYDRNLHLALPTVNKMIETRMKGKKYEL